MLCVNGIESAQSVRALQIVFAPKKDGLLQFYTNYRKLDAANRNDNFEILQMDEFLVSSGKQHILSTIHASFVY